MQPEPWHLSTRYAATPVSSVAAVHARSMRLSDIGVAVRAPGAVGGCVAEAGETTVTSFATLLAELRSPPPDTIAELVTLAGAALDTATVKVTIG